MSLRDRSNREDILADVDRAYRDREYRVAQLETSGYPPNLLYARKHPKQYQKYARERADQRPHYYKHKGKYCTPGIDDPAWCYERRATEYLQTYPAPGRGGYRKAKDGDRTRIMGLAPVHTKIHPDGSITNITETSHVYHPGTVHRRVVRDKNGIHVVSEGEGTGNLATINEHSGRWIWQENVERMRDRAQRDHERAKRTSRPWRRSEATPTRRRQKYDAPPPPPVEY